jgi:nitrite reductase (NO-forming)
MRLLLPTARFAQRFVPALALVSLFGLAACAPEVPEGQESMVLLPPPEVPPPIDRRSPTRIVIELETNERTTRLADGVDYTFWTFGGTVPGPFLRVRQGDEVEFRIANHPSSMHPHNIDLHAVTGPGGGAHSSLVAPAQSATFVFRALNPGLYVYHCATTPVAMHIANGMYGLILVEPREGLTPVDREYYVMQGEVYTRDGFGTPGHQPFDMARAIDEDPAYVVFNGSVGAISDERALTASVGETVRLFVGNGGPNLVSSTHVIGEIFDRVWHEAGTLVNENVQSTLIPAGGAAILEFALEVPGTFLLVDHSLTRAFNKGALGMLRVEGPEDPSIYSGRIAEGVYAPEGGAIQSVGGTPPAAQPEMTQAQRLEAGSRTYAQSCAACHHPLGVGVPGVFPPLAGSDYLNADPQRAVGIVLAGLTGPITVNGVEYTSAMPALHLTDDEIANVLSWVYSQWGNSGAVVTAAEVALARAGTH